MKFFKQAEQMPYFNYASKNHGAVAGDPEPTKNYPSKTKQVVIAPESVKQELNPVQKLVNEIKG